MNSEELKNDVLNRVYSGGSTPKKMTRTHSEGDYNKAT
jgi:hypothetical protein